MAVAIAFAISDGLLGRAGIAFLFCWALLGPSLLLSLAALRKSPLLTSVVRTRLQFVTLTHVAVEKQNLLNKGHSRSYGSSPMPGTMNNCSCDWNHRLALSGNSFSQLMCSMPLTVGFIPTKTQIISDDGL